MSNNSIQQSTAGSLYQPRNQQAPIDSNLLFKQGNIVLIMHQGEQYTLRCTRNGKLILNK